MAKYTTEVRTVLESLLGRSEHGDADDMESIIEQSWSLVFDADIYSQFVYYHWYDGTNPDTGEFDEFYYGDMLCQHILRQFYSREICCESVGLWIQWMNERLVNNLDYIKQLYDGQIQLMFMWTSQQSKLKTIEHHRYYGDYHSFSKIATELSGSDTSAITNRNSDSSDYDNTNANSNKHIYSDTPQGDFELIDGVEPTPNNVLLYATDGQVTTGGGTDTNDVNATGTRVDSKSQTFTGNYDYYRSFNGDDGQNWGRKVDFGGMLMQEYRTANASAFIDTDAVIDKLFSDLFIQLW